MAEHLQSSEYQLVNAYASWVETTVARMIRDEPGMCQCEKCFLDVCAIVYNSGFAHYVTTIKGELLATLPHKRDNKDVDLMVAAMKAIERVKETPLH